MLTDEKRKKLLAGALAVVMLTGVDNLFCLLVKNLGLFKILRRVLVYQGIRFVDFVVCLPRARIGCLSHGSSYASKKNRQT